MKIKAVVTDIEGTTSSIRFVKDVLFPYASAHLESFLRENLNVPAVVRLLEDVREIAGKPMDVEALVLQLQQWIREDAKITPLKTLQGMLWEQGFRQKDFVGHVYEDVVTALRSWHSDGIRLYIYSSGSVQAQKLLFSHTAYGDLTPLFSGYFDTTIGSKKEVESYRNLIKEIDLLPDTILFLSDIEAELDAARESGLHTMQLVRPEDGTQSSNGHVGVTDFSIIRLRDFGD